MNKQYVKFESGVDKQSEIFNLVIEPVINKSGPIIIRVVRNSGDYGWIQITQQMNQRFIFGAPRIVVTHQNGVQQFFDASDNLIQFFNIETYFNNVEELTVFYIDPYDIYSIKDILDPLAKDIFGYCDTTFVASLDKSNLIGVLDFGIGKVVIKIDYKNGFIDIDKSESIKEKTALIDTSNFFKDSAMTIADFHNLFSAIDEKYKLPNEI